MTSNQMFSRMHGGTTHFPIALVIVSMLFDLIAFAIRREPYTKELHIAAFYCLMVGALGSFAAVLSGLWISRWETFGSGMLGKHHIFIWPGFALLIGMAGWRLVVRDKASRRAFALYLAVGIVTAVLIAGGGYWGGEMLMALQMNG